MVLDPERCTKGHLLAQAMEMALRLEITVPLMHSSGTMKMALCNLLLITPSGCGLQVVVHVNIGTGSTNLFIWNQTSTTGVTLGTAGVIQAATDIDQLMLLNRLTNDGTLVTFAQQAPRGLLVFLDRLFLTTAVTLLVGHSLLAVQNAQTFCVVLC